MFSFIIYELDICSFTAFQAFLRWLKKIAIRWIALFTLRGLRGWLHGEISARAGISARLLTY